MAREGHSRNHESPYKEHDHPHMCRHIYIYIYFSLTRAMHGKVLKNTKIFQLRSAQFSEKMNVTINVFGGLREI